MIARNICDHRRISVVWKAAASSQQMMAISNEIKRIKSIVEETEKGAILPRNQSTRNVYKRKCIDARRKASDIFITKISEEAMKFKSR